MRTILVVGLFFLLSPASAMAQGAPPTETPGSPPAATPAPAVTPPEARRPRAGRDITREEYLEAVKRRAEKRFDQMDTNHDGILSMDERRAARAKRQQKSAPE